MKIINLSGVLLGVAVLFSQHAIADDVEYKVKAGYLYNFTKFIAWPQDKSETFNLCIVGGDPFGGLIDPIEQRSAFGRPIKLFRFNNLNKEQRCHILFISASSKDNLSLKDIRGDHKTLTVGETEDFAAQGGMIGFINRQGKIKLQINLKMLQRSDLAISAKLLEVSELVEEEAND
ncbi:YfiR family protein [Candidatus Methylobacter oryzae]|uniref:YfiR family protein n=1 Tax=Candidatus Methylobacter oryzae TaxID=2497749 RepID=A0ABY3CEV3_9GAMM|nr:YfiR family protein [Candidatus Methylobacter oryzae]TRX00722.1 YfiR family protein [Candidatus Methylobacter oryzae]